MPAQAANRSLADLSDRLGALVDGVASKLVAIRSRRRTSLSGFVWRPGLVITAEEALEADEDIAILRPDGTSVAAGLVGRDPTTDIVLLRTEEQPVGELALAPTASLRAGHVVVAAGCRPEGPTAAFGIVSLAGGPWRSLRGGMIDRRIHLDLRLDPRAEGGLAIDAGGNAIGMTVLGPRGGALVIPSETIERVAQQLLQHGRVARGYLGLGLQPVRIDRGTAAAPERDDTRGLIVVSVDSDGPGQRAGIKQGDILIRWNDHAVQSVRSVHSLLGPESVGQSVRIEILRAGERLALSIEIGERPGL
ncbi:S1C family serine protease [Microvirga subterranea]|uniref:S1-C subfamily serine protease n=1 Tax=Microvirga subterranea TaxID=186651 RepID=A0A370HJ49_9HYPH|nr:S1C family serine protease [Microvirga subterranea]RDI57985.1 S1-C subfamily serine protease [Microvirga subterranea]